MMSRRIPGSNYTQRSNKDLRENQQPPRHLLPACLPLTSLMCYRDIPTWNLYRLHRLERRFQLSLQIQPRVAVSTFLAFAILLWRDTVIGSSPRSMMRHSNLNFEKLAIRCWRRVWTLN